MMREREAAKVEDPTAKAKPKELEEVNDPLPQRGFALLKMADAEPERHLDATELLVTDQDLEQDLEPLGAKASEVNRLAPNEEESAQRIADALQANWQEHSRSRGRAT